MNRSERNALNYQIQVARKAEWMTLFEAELLALRPDLAGRIPWADANYLYTEAAMPKQAALRISETHKA